MKFTQKHALMALVTVSLIASGCASTSGGGNTDQEAGTNPIQVTEFSAFPNDPAPAGNTVTFTLELANNGNADATNVVGKLWNPPFAADSGDTRTWMDTNGENVSVPDRSFDFGTLQGQEDVETFSTPASLRLTAPSLDPGQSFPYNFHAKYYYGYQTQGSTTITAMGNEQYRDSGSSKSQSVSIDHNSAPITLDGQLLAGNPIVFYEGDGSSKKVQFCVVVNNDGGGTVFSDPEGALQGEEEYVIGDRKNKVELTVTSVGTTEISTEENGNYGSEASEVVTLVGGDQVRNCFYMEVDSLANAGSQTEIGPINIQANYGYVEDTSTRVTVQGR